MTKSNMKRRSSPRSLIPVATLGILSAAGQTYTPTQVVPVPSDSPNRFGVSFRAGFNIKTEFQHFGAFTPPGALRLTPGGDAFNYDNGYVLTDSSGNAFGYTRYWGYDSASQLPGNGTILMHRDSSIGSSQQASDEDVLPGFELTYARELQRGNKWSWGFEGAVNYMRVSVKDSSPMYLEVNRQTDAYALPALEGGGYVSPPPAPYYHGPNLSPGGNPVIGAIPVSSSISTVFTSVTGQRNFEANVLGFRLGPYVEFALNDRIKLSLSGGFAVAGVNSDFDFNESVPIPGVPTVNGSGSESDWLAGGYVAANATVKINENWEMFGGVQFQDLGKYSHRESGRAAVLDLSKATMVVVGANYSF